MIFEGDLSVIKAIKEKKRLMDAGEPHDHIRPAMIQCGGLMHGVYGVGTALALQEMGHIQTFTSLIGASSGAVVIAHFAAGTTEKGIDMLTKDCCNPKFVNFWRFWNQVDTKYFIDIIKNDERKKIDVEKISKNPAQLYIGVADYKTAKPVLIKPKNKDHFFKAMHASINMQNVSSSIIVIDGIHYADGGFSKPYITSAVIREIKPTHLLVIANDDKRFRPVTWLERLMNRTVFRLRLSGILAHAINSRQESRSDSIKEAFDSEVETAIIWGDSSIHWFEKNPKKIKSAIEASRTWLHGLFSQEK